MFKNHIKQNANSLRVSVFLRYQTESNRRKRFCRPSPSHSAMIPCHWDCKNTTFFNIQTIFRKLFFSSFIAPLNPEPQTPHQPAPSKEKNIVNPLRNGVVICVLVDDFVVLLRRDVGVIICSCAEVVVFDYASAIHHNKNCQNQSDYHHNDGNHLENYVFSAHYLKKSRLGISNTTPESRNHTANNVRMMLNSCPTM